jgi:hypothetical protein
MVRVRVRIFHAEPAPDAGPLSLVLGQARSDLAMRQTAAFETLGAMVEVTPGAPDDTSFGARLRQVVETDADGGLVIMGSGSVPLARPRDFLPFVRTARSVERVALANNRYSADIVAIACARTLREVPDLPSDNALPRWLEEVAGYAVTDLRRQWRLGIDLDSPIDLLLVDRTNYPGLDPARARFAAVARVGADRRAEIVVAGRSSAATLGWLERTIPARVRALIEERGLRAASPLASGGQDASDSRRPPRSVLGALIDRDGPDALAARLAELGDAAIVDTRVLLAHRLGADERSWPREEDRFASDLLLPDRIEDPWLRSLTASAADAAIPIILGGHSVVGPGLRLVFRAARWT